MTYLTETFIPYTKVLTPLLLEGLWITIYVSALAFLLSIILGAVILKESVSILKCIGVLVIIMGVLMIAGGDEE